MTNTNAPQITVQPFNFSTVKPRKRAAFTLAEVLITLAIIGVVAAITIPSLIIQNQQKGWDTAATVFERKLDESLKVMNTQGTLSGYTTTEDFVNELSKHLKITKVCKNDDILSCFEDKVYWGNNAEEVDMSTIKISSNMGQQGWGTNTVGIQLNNGTSAVVAYNPECRQDPYSNQVTASSCLAVLYDTSGYAKPNTSGKDLRSINVPKLNEKCAFEINNTCYTAPFKPKPHVWNACDENGRTTDAEDLKFMADYGIRYCMTSNSGTDDYWAGAVKACGGIDKMPTMAQLGEMANYIYNTKGIGARDEVSNLARDDEKASSLGYNFTKGGNIYVFSGEEGNGYAAYGRAFLPSYTGWNYHNRYYSYLYTVCLGD